MLGEDLLKEILKPLIKDVYDLIKDESKQYVSNRLLEYQVELYRKCNYQKTLLHRFEDVLIENFYVPLFLRPYDSYGTRSTARISTGSIKNVIRPKQNIIIFGYAGSGKSTLVKNLIASSIKENYKIPIFIELRNLIETSGDFDKYVLSNIFQYQNLGISNEIIERLLKKDHFIFVLDGFDEIPSALKAKVSQSIADFRLKYTNNNFLITSRYYEPLNSFSSYKSYEICEFSPSEVRAFIHKQFHGQDNSKPKQIVDELEKAKNSTIQEYLKTPLLLSLFIITFLTHPEIPFNKSEFYYNIFDSLFYRLDKYLKADFAHEKLSKLSKGEFIKVLSSLCVITTFEGVYEFTEQYLNHKIDTIKEIKHFQFETQDFLTDVTVNIGIILQDGIFYKFPHRTIQDYFCANFLISITDADYKVQLYDTIAKKATQFIFLIELLLEIDYLDAVEYLVLPTITDYIEKGKKYSTIVPITANAGINHRFDYILHILEMNAELRSIKSDFVNHHLHDSLLAQRIRSEEMLFERSMPGEMKKRILKQITFIDHAPSLCSSIKKHIEKIKKEDKKIIDILKYSR